MPDDQPSKPPDDVLDITWDDLREPPAPAGEQFPVAPPEAPSLDLSGEFPPVEGAIPVADSRRPWIEITGMCGRAKQPFAVRFVENTPGLYSFAETVALAPPPGKAAGFFGQGAPGKAGTAPPPLGPSGQAQGRFDLKNYTGCPVCGQPGLVQCDRCGTVMCGSALLQDKRGMYCQCPNCGGKGRIESGVPVTVSGQVGGVKGGKPGKR
jgi:hypothetical protein